MKIAIVGAGAIGGYLGARLSAAGEDVTFIARNRNLEAINANGFRLILEDGSELHAKDAKGVQRYEDDDGSLCELDLANCVDCHSTVTVSSRRYAPTDREIIERRDAEITALANRRTA